MVGWLGFLFFFAVPSCPSISSLSLVYPSLSPFASLCWCCLTLLLLSSATSSPCRTAPSGHAQEQRAAITHSDDFWGQQSKCAVIGVPSLESPERHKLLGSLSDLPDNHQGCAEQHLCQRACNPVLIRHLDMTLFTAVQKTNECVFVCVRAVDYNGQTF